MKTFSLFPVVILAGVMFHMPCHATEVSACTIEQPVNLGSKSDPARIPLGRVGVISNYDYGIHWYIGEEQSCPGGAMHWEGGLELNQNLASVFGISVEAQDSTQISAFPVTLRVKPWKPPGYSPYTKDQVLAATLWCLLHRTHGTPEHPLDVRVIAEGADEKPLETKYSGKYITDPGHDGKEVPPVKVPGYSIEVDARGISWVVFPDVTRKSQSVSPTPGMIIMEAGGDGDPGWYLLPVWGNGENPNEYLRLNFRTANICYSSYHSKGVMNANSFIAAGGAMNFEVKHTENGDSVEIAYPHVPQDTLAAEILALVVSAQPTVEKNLTVTILIEDYNLARYPAFRDAKGWKETKASADKISFECEFAWDAVARKLLKGTVPLVHMETKDWIAPNLEDELKVENTAIELAARVKQRISNGIHDGSLLAEKNMGQNHLADVGLPREVGKAGYYEALATYSSGTKLPDKLQVDPVKIADDLFDQDHRAGWTFGLSRCQAIEIEVRKEIEKENLKKNE